jgi:hypothetical protein
MVRQLGRRRPQPCGHAPQGFGAAVSQHAHIPGDPASGIDDHADRRRSRHRTRRQLRIIGSDRLGADDHGIHQCPQPVQVLPVFDTRDVICVTGPRGDEAVDALSQLGNDDRRSGSDQRPVPIEQQRVRSGSGAVWHPAPQQLAPHVGEIPGAVMPHPIVLGCQVVGILGALGDRQRQPGSHLNAKLSEPRALVRVRRQQPDSPYTKITEDGCGHAVITGVNWQPQSQICVDRVEACVLQRVRVQLGMEADATSLVTAQIDDHPQTFAADLPHRGLQLLAAVAAPRSEGVPGETLGVHSNQGNMAVVPGVVEIAQHQRQVFPARRDRVPVYLEGAVRGRKHSRDHPAYSLRFGHLAKPYTEAGAEGNLPLSPHSSLHHVLGLRSIGS